MTDQVRFMVGIDLGTTNTVMSYIDTQTDTESPQVNLFEVDQLTQPGTVEARQQLPSFCYLPSTAEVKGEELSLPWGQPGAAAVGSIARHLGAKTPLRLVSSAKSWLCHGGVDRRSAFLPLNAPEDVTLLSPLDASVAYLKHLRANWNHRFPEQPLETQDLTLTVPASFDPAARDLTAEAGRLAGLENIRLLEEPQAAVYHWVKAMGDDWRERVQLGDVILVVDVGGGTTDLSLVTVVEEAGNLSLERIAVGEHILLGGDIMDLALAYRIKQKLEQDDGPSLQPWQIQALTHACRDAKETLLQDNDVQEVPIIVPSRGAKLLSNTLRTELTRDEVAQSLVDGFFPEVQSTEQPKQARRGALTQRGLPYAQDPGITRHLAAFLCRHGDATAAMFGLATDFIKPTAVLFNGGVFKANHLTQRVMSVINQWLKEAGAPDARVLDGCDLDLGVAKGAAYYGFVRQGHGVRIRGGLGSAYYVGIESSMPAVPGMPVPLQALCVAPFGMEEGTETATSAQEFGLVVGEPVEFQFFGSTVRKNDQPGTLLDSWGDDELEELPPIQATLSLEGGQPGEVIPVRLAARVNELGTLCLEAVPRGDEWRWQVEFDVRQHG